MSYRQVLDDAIGEAPPSTIEVAGIVGRQRRRMAMQRAFGASVTAAVAVALVAGGLALAQSLIRRPSTASPAIANVSPASVSGHLDQVLWTDLSAVAHDLSWVTASRPVVRLNTRPDSRDWLSKWIVNGDHRTYLAQGTVSSQGRIGTILFNIEHDRSGPSCPPADSDATRDGHCTISVGPHGEAIQTEVYHYANTSPGQVEIIVNVYRPDGMRILAENRNQSGMRENDTATGAEPPLTADQLTQIALDPALALPASWK